MNDRSRILLPLLFAATLGPLLATPAAAQDDGELAAARSQVEKELPEISQLIRSGRQEAVADSPAMGRIRAIPRHREALHAVAGEIFGDLDTRVAAFEAIAVLGDEKSVYDILLILNDPNEPPRIRIKAIDVAARFGDARVLMPLVDIIALEERDEKTGEGSLSGISYNRWAGLKMRAAGAIAGFGADEVGRVITDRLIRYLTEEIANPSTVASAARCLGLLRCERAAVDLRRVLRLPNLTPVVKGEIYVALGRIGDAASLPEIVKGLDDPDPSVQIEAINGLGHMGPAAAAHTERLVSRMTDAAAPLEVRYTIPAALIQIGPGDRAICQTLVGTLGQRIEPPEEMAFDERAQWILHVAAKAALQFAEPRVAVPLLAARAEEETPTGETVQALLVHLTKDAFASGGQPPQTRADWQSWWSTRGQAFFEK